MPKTSRVMPEQRRTKGATSSFMRPMTPSAQLALVVGAEPMPRTQVIKKVWDYIKQQKLQDAGDRRMINADDRLKPVFGRPKVDMFEMTKLVNAHLS